MKSLLVPVPLSIRKYVLNAVVARILPVAEFVCTRSVLLLLTGWAQWHPNAVKKARMMFDEITEIPKAKYGDAFSVRKFTHDDLSMNRCIYLPHTITSIDGRDDLPFM